MSSAKRPITPSKEAYITKNTEKTASEVLNEVVPESIKSLPAYKSLVREAEATETRRKRDSLLNEVLNMVNARIGTDKPMTTLAQFVVYFGDRKKASSVRGKRAPRMTEEQKAKIGEMRGQNKPLSEIREAVGVTEAQLNSFLYAKKKA